jgi:two-component system OmpR family response regulator
MQKYTVLVVDDDPHIRDVLRYALEKEGISVIEAENGCMGVEKTLQLKPHIIIMDVMMPELSGLEACQILRRTQNIPILFLSSRDSETDRVLGLELGGDDYVNKPFSPRELMARVKVMLRRLDSSHNRNTQPFETLSHQGLQMDCANFQVRWLETEISLTVTEFNLLEALMRSPNRVFTRELLAESDIFKDIITERTIDSHIRRLRRKLTTAGCLNAIETVHGFGYRLGLEP